MILDIILILFLLIVGTSGFRNGLWLSLINLVCSVVAVFLGYKFYMQVAHKLDLFIPFPKTKAYDMTYAFEFSNLQQRFNDVIAFIIVVFIARLLLHIVIGIFGNMMQSGRSALLSRVLGVIPSIVIALFIAALGVYIIALYPDEHLQHQLATSKLAELILYHIPYISNFIQHL